MAQGKRRGLELPQQAKPDNDSFDLRPRRVNAWVAGLPMGNIGETSKLLYRALHDANRHSHSWKRRYHFLEAIREPLHLIQQSIGQRYIGQPFPLPPKTQQIANLARHLYIEMAIGYKAAIEDMLASLFLFQSRRALKIMVHRGCRYLNLSLLTSYQVYTQQHSGIWHELHHLYRYAEQNDFHQDSITDPYFTDLPESSIARVYKQIVLLATTSPFRLRQGEALAIHQALARWSGHGKLLNSDDEDADEALFVIHMDSDDEPDYQAFDQRPCEGSSCRLIDTRQLLQIIQEESRYHTSSPGALLNGELLNRLIQTWGSAPHRSEQRSEGGQGIQVVVGMTRIHNLLAPALLDEAQESHLSHFESRAVPVIEVRQSSNEDVWNIYSAKAYAHPPIDYTPSDHQGGSPSAQPANEAEAQRWEVRNASSGGFRLAIPEQQHAGLRVGELLALREEFSHNRWQLACIRWMRHFPHTGMEAGVQILAPQMVAIMVKNLAPGKVQGDFQRGLLLPALSEQALHATLITPARLFQADERVMLHVPRNEIEVTLGNAIQDSGTFVQFEFSTGQQPSQSPREEPPSGHGGSAYEKLWAQL